MRTNKKETKLSLNKMSIANLGTLEKLQQKEILGGGTETCNDPTLVPVNCQP